MIAIIFEVLPAKGKWDDYLNTALQLKPALETMPGFLSVERFQSLSDPQKILSLSFWADEESVRHWRNLEVHREAQALGRASVFQNYRLRVAEVNRDYGMYERAEAPADSQQIHQHKTRS